MIPPLSTNPAHYAAFPPEQVLGRIRRETEQLCDGLGSRLGELRQPDEVDLFWNIRGTHRVREKVLQMLSQARQRVAISLWSEDLPDYEPALRAAHASGALLIINVFGAAEIDFGQVYWHEDSSKAVNGRLVTLVVDYSRP